MKRHLIRQLRAAAFVVAAAAVLAPLAQAAAPVNTTAPSITGTAQQGSTLTAQNGSWDNNPASFAYQWQRCTAAGVSCTNITNASEKTYNVTGNDVGHRLRIRVSATNADGTTTADSATTAVVTSTAAPKNTDRPTLAGTAKVGSTLTADEGSWSGNPDSFTFAWQRCDSDGSNCAVFGATGRSYLVRTADLGFRLRALVTARNEKGTGTATTGVTPIVAPATPITNHRPTLKILSVRFLGAQVYARMRICDDSMKNLSIIQTDMRPGRASYTRRFSTLIPPRPCGVYTRNWLPAQRFRGDGRYTIMLRARDKSAFTSLPARRTFSR